jgi:exodeoxyribonuclease VII small subunit
MKTATFEENLELTKGYIERLMDKDVTLEESIELYQKAQDVIAQAQKMLEEAKLKVEEIKKDRSGVDR